MTGPDLPTPAEEKLIAQMIEADVDHAIEQKHLHEIPTVCEGLGEDYE